jgi:hypothetical protein
MTGLPTPTVTDSWPFSNVLRPKETWRSTTKLTARLIGCQLGFQEREARPVGYYLANPELVEKLMGYPVGWCQECFSNNSVA